SLRAGGRSREPPRQPGASDPLMVTGKSTSPILTALVAMAVLGAACGGSGSANGSPGASPTATVGSGGGSGGGGAPPGSLPGSLPLPALQLAVLSSVGGHLAYCDPDLYPVQQGDALQSARRRLPTIKADHAAYAAILAHEHLKPGDHLTNVDLLQI